MVVMGRVSILAAVAELRVERAAGAAAVGCRDLSALAAAFEARTLHESDFPDHCVCKSSCRVCCGSPTVQRVFASEGVLLSESSVVTCESRPLYLSLSLRAWDCVASARRGLPPGRKIYLLT